MIQPATLLPLAPSLPQGSARLPGGGLAFLLPDTEEGKGELTLLAGGGTERPDDAGAGNALPDAPTAIDPWLIATMLSPAAPTVAVDGQPVAPAPSAAQDGGSVAPLPPAATTPARAADATTSPLLMAPGTSADPAPTMPRNVRPTTQEQLDTEVTTVTSPGAGDCQMAPDIAIDMPATAVCAPPAREGYSGSEHEHAAIDRRSSATASVTPPLDPEVVADRPDAQPPARVVQAAAVTAPGTGNPPTSPPLPTSGDAKVPAAPVPDTVEVLPAAALTTSALTPLRRREIAAVAALVDHATAPAPVAATADTIASAVLQAAPPSREGAPAVQVVAPMPLDVARATPPPPPEMPVSAAIATLPLGWRVRTPALATSAVAAATALPIATSAAVSDRPSPPAAIVPITAASGSTPVGVVNAPTVPIPAPLAPTSQPVATDDAPRPREAAPVAVVPTMTPATPLPAAQPSAIVFGAARYAAQGAERRDDPLPPTGGTAAGTTVAAMPVAAAAPPVAQAPLDVRHEHWPTAMIERIEMIRDAANEADTRIRLVPDALGAIDVDVRRDGDTLHVRFTAEQPQTRALLQDAAPRLAEAADARGLRLGQATVGGDASASAQQQHGRSPQQQPAAPPRAPRFTAEAATADADDTRLA